MIVAPRKVDLPTTGPRFEILQNPFAVLSLPPDASREDVVEAFEDRMADTGANEGALREARRQLFAPKLRMEATVEYLPDATQAGREASVEALSQPLRILDLQVLADTLPPFSRTTLISYVAMIRPGPETLSHFVSSRSKTDRDAVAGTVAELMAVSGSPRPQIEAINEVIDQVTVRNADRLFVAYADISAAARDITHCLEAELPLATNDQISALSIVVDAYVRKSMPRLQAARRKIEEAAESLERDPTNFAALQSLISFLNEWDTIAQPQQLLAHHKGRDEGGARDLFEFLRGLMLDLTNKHDKPSIALEINKACIEVFLELPRAEHQLREDHTLLESLAAQEMLHDLDLFAVSAKKDPDPLIRDLEQSGFGEGARGNAGRLYAIFNKSLADTQGTRAVEYVWGFVRGLALEFNNELGEAAASRRLLEGLRGHPKFRDAPAEIRKAIETDLQTARSNAIHAELNRAIQQGDRKQARAHLAQLASITEDPVERLQYQETISQIDGANRRRLVKWSVWGLIGLVAIGFAVTQDSSRGSRSNSQSIVATTEEVMPAVGSNQSFDRGNVRYCVYQNARLDAANAMLAFETNDAVIEAFNVQVDDYNSRCGSYRYFPRDMSAVEGELVAKRSVLTAEGQGMVRTWRAKH